MLRSSVATPATAYELHRAQRLPALNILDTPREERFDRLTRLATRLFGVPIAAVSLADVNHLWLKSCTGLSVEDMPDEPAFFEHAIIGDDILCIEDTLLNPDFRDSPFVVNPPHIRFYAGCPLQIFDGIKVGTLCLLDHQPHPFSDSDKEMLRDLAALAAQEIATSQMSTMDELTLLANRRWLLTVGEHTLGLCKRLGKPATLFYFDLDHFKDINDHYGHQEGDYALTTFAELLTENFRDSDVVARMGGDEFVALITDCTTADSLNAADRLIQLVDRHNRLSGRGYNIEFSVGMIEYDPIHHHSLNDLLEAADIAMYDRKRQRRLET